MQDLQQPNNHLSLQHLTNSSSAPEAPARGPTSDKKSAYNTSMRITQGCVFAGTRGIGTLAYNGTSANFIGQSSSL